MGSVGAAKAIHSVEADFSVLLIIKLDQELLFMYAEFFF